MTLEKLVSMIMEFKQEVDNKFDNLKEYVDNRFDKLELCPTVSQEIENLN